MDQLEAELEDELERLQIHLDSELTSNHPEERRLKVRYFVCPFNYFSLFLVVYVFTYVVIHMLIYCWMLRIGCNENSLNIDPQSPICSLFSLDSLYFSIYGSSLFSSCLLFGRVTMKLK